MSGYIPSCNSELHTKQMVDLRATVDRWLALPLEERSRVVVVSDLNQLLTARYGSGKFPAGKPTIVAEVVRTIDTRPCEPLRPEDCEHEEAPFPGSGSPAYDGYGNAFTSTFLTEDPQRPVSEHPEPVLALSMPSSWYQHLKWSLSRRWPRLFGRLEVLWTQQYRVPR